MLITAVQFSSSSLSSWGILSKFNAKTLPDFKESALFVAEVSGSTSISWDSDEISTAILWTEVECVEVEDQPAAGRDLIFALKFFQIKTVIAIIIIIIASGTIIIIIISKTLVFPFPSRELSWSLSCFSFGKSSWHTVSILRHWWLSGRSESSHCFWWLREMLFWQHLVHCWQLLFSQ